MKKVAFLIIGLFVAGWVYFTYETTSEKEAEVNFSTYTPSENKEEIVCTLSESDLIERKEKLKSEIFSKTTKVEEVKFGYIFHFKDEATLLPKLTEFIVTEQKCCKFFQYDLSIKSSNRGIALKISGPILAKIMIEEMVNTEI